MQEESKEESMEVHEACVKIMR